MRYESIKKRLDTSNRLGKTDHVLRIDKKPDWVLQIDEKTDWELQIVEKILRTTNRLGATQTLFIWSFAVARATFELQNHK